MTGTGTGTGNGVGGRERIAWLVEGTMEGFKERNPIHHPVRRLLKEKGGKKERGKVIRKKKG